MIATIFIALALQANSSPAVATAAQAPQVEQAQPQLTERERRAEERRQRNASLVCENRPRTGSTLTRRICTTRQAAQTTERESKQYYEQFQSQQSAINMDE